ncbi:helix-turn-helix domain-containing protein [Faecalitalea cylindroides]|uniref:helix-turn-helix domain-containing protein n=1 Tax=Faecalitalea cylindroides TaxID=39483 RepID=UPI000B39EF84|nr:helix-turn-helix transcriptional regulator [Faecalitalea cylindroides]OUN63740.1 hypothetical protein B5G15_01215 [Faecalitalea cylindroides]
MKFRIDRHINKELLDYRYESCSEKEQISTGYILYAVRSQLGISRTEVARYLGVSDAVLSNWENGTVPSNLMLLFKWMSFLLVSSDSIFTYYQKFDEKKEKINWSIPVLDSISWNQGIIKYHYLKDETGIAFAKSVSYSCKVAELSPYVLGSDCIFLDNKRYIAYRVTDKYDSDTLEMLIALYRWYYLLKDTNNLLLYEKNDEYFEYPVIMLNLRKKAIERKIIRISYNDAELLDEIGNPIKQRTYRILYLILDEHSLIKNEKAYNSVRLDYTPYPIKPRKKKAKNKIEPD